MSRNRSGTFRVVVALAVTTAVLTLLTTTGATEPSRASSADTALSDVVGSHARLDVALHVFGESWCLHLQLRRPFALVDSCEDEAR